MQRSWGGDISGVLADSEETQVAEAEGARRRGVEMRAEKRRRVRSCWSLCGL